MTSALMSYVCAAVVLIKHCPPGTMWPRRDAEENQNSRTLSQTASEGRNGIKRNILAWKTNKEMTLKCSAEGWQASNKTVILNLLLSKPFNLLKKEILHCEGCEALEQVAQKSCVRPTPGSAEGQIGWGLEQPLGEGVLAYGSSIRTRWFLRFLPTQTVQRFHDFFLWG